MQELKNDAKVEAVDGELKNDEEYNASVKKSDKESILERRASQIRERR